MKYIAVLLVIFCTHAQAKEVIFDVSESVLSAHRDWVPSSDGFSNTMASVIGTQVAKVQDFFTPYLLLETQLMAYQYFASGAKGLRDNKDLVSQAQFLHRSIYLAAYTYRYLSEAVNSQRYAQAAPMAVNLLFYYFYSDWRLGK